ncbi:MAG: RluA family pseudouridine synthase [Candidatus Omnitrophica bacterium]|nr:RluA family pseudouridine synthase [Candidatus Omnitrophota bacterium]
MSQSPNPYNTPKTTIDSLYEDKDCAVFYKPAGLLTIPTDKNEEFTLVSIVNQQRTDAVALHPAHRLDRDTSGVILFAKGKENQQILMNAFKEKQVKKTYIAFVHGHVESSEGKIRIPIKDFYQRKFQKNLPPQSALTLYKVLEYRKDFTIVEVNPITGRTNQIRIHFTKIGHPLVGEDKYVFRKDFALRFRRTALHAAQLIFPHPVNQKMITVKAPLAQDMTNFLEKTI